jgi:FixJ family two-component response regulator
MELLIYSQGWRPQTCDSAREFLVRPRPFVPSSLILAFSSTDSSGLEVQKLIARECAEVPIIVVSDHGDIPTTVQAMKAGAVDFLVKPLSEEMLVTAIRQSLLLSSASLVRFQEVDDLRNLYASLSPREQQVMALVVSGLLNKQVAAELKHFRKWCRPEYRA